MFRFEDPWLLLTALVIPIIIYSYFKCGRSGRIRYSSIDTLKRLKPSKSVKMRHSLIFLRAFALLFLTLAFARPQSGIKTTEHLTEGIDIILCLDTSGSMKALDFKVKGKRKDRLTVVKDVVEDFIKVRENDRIGMVVFGDEAFTQCPLTLDYGVLTGFLDKTQVGMAGESTAIGSAIAVSVKRLKDVPAKSKVIVLLTDGMNNAGRISPDIAADAAKAMGVKIYTIGVGSDGLVPFLVDGLFGPNYVNQRVELDEETLKKIAEKTGGKYFKATDTKGLKEVYDTIDAMEKTEIKVKEYMEYNELFPGFLMLGLFLILAEVALANTRFRKIP
jgi:Ca-activated chloride channel family protein